MTTTSQRKIAPFMLFAKPFTASALTGRTGSGDVGRLYGALLDRYRADRDSIAYTVLSYATPIAYLTTDGRWVALPGRYSVTTSKQISRVRYALAANDVAFEEVAA